MQTENVILLFKMLIHNDTKVKIQLKEEITSGGYELNQVLEKLVESMESK
ncbi:hypothetical protein [Alkaliphilus metalliredigens]|nr:hypothetical protein [Alkaliphilus metalliredigens]